MKRLLAGVTVLLACLPAGAQQVVDTAYQPAITRPAYAPGMGPLVLVDRGHHNLHAPDDQFELIANLLRRDGYRVEGSTGRFTASSLAGASVLLIVNALAGRDSSEWTLPTTPAFSAGEVAALKTWIQDGGSLLLIADHMPFPGALSGLDSALGVAFLNGFAIVEAEWDPLVFRRLAGTLRSHPVIEGRNTDERVETVVTFVSGSAFEPLAETVQPLLVFGPDVVSINPRRAWQFDDATPRVPVTGWLQGALIEFGAGRVAIFGEAAMFAAQLVGPRRRPTGLNSPIAGQNLQLLLNTMHWLSRLPGM